MKPFIKQRLAMAVLLAATAGSAVGQETTSAIRGKILTPAGEPMTNTTIVIIDDRTGASRTYTTNSAGSFYAPKLSVGGPYTVIINEDQKVVVDSISLGDVYNLTYGYEEKNMEEVTVYADASSVATTAVGPSSTFGLFELENNTSGDRDIVDIIAIDPRINLDPGTGGITCAGKHPRFNSTTLDGVSQNDRFGLNSNGYSTATGMPFPFAAIEQVSVELAPYAVQYGGFSACTINAVSKAGTNEFHGGVFYQYTDDSLKGDSIDYGHGESSKFESESYDTYRRGFDFGGPILKDKLFFYVSYEESESPEFIAQGYNGGSGDTRDWLSETDYNRIADIARNVYGYEPGGQPGNGVQEEEKYAARIDWNITDSHSLALIYNYYEGFEDRASDSDSDEFEFANHFYRKGAESETTTAKWSAQWTDTFSTELFISHNEMNDSQVNVADQGFGEMQISIGSNIVYLGTDDSRQSNALNTESDYFKFNSQLLAGDHVLTAGYEQEALSVFNLFVQHSDGGEYRFFDSSSSGGLSGIDKFELGTPNRVYYGSGGGTNNPNDAAASFENVQHTLYIQDEWYIAPKNLTLVYGLRYEKFTSDDAPNTNPAFEDYFGVPNDTGVDGLDILMPRFGFTWGAADSLTIRGGIGLFSGGNPNVWISNAWSNDGVTNVQVSNTSYADSILTAPLANGGAPGFAPPQSLYDIVAATTVADGNISYVNIIDPDYEQPGEWKYSLGFTQEFESGWTLDGDFIYSQTQDAAYYQDISQEIVGYTTTGAPIYDYADSSVRDVYMLTNSDRTAEGFVASLNLSKAFDNGFYVSVGYAQTRSEDISPMTSSTAGSNFDNTALLDINDPRPGTSNYETPHRFSLYVNYTHAFIGDLDTKISLRAVRKQGQGQSYVMDGQDLEGDGYYGRHLLYVPTGADDPNVVFADGFDQDAFFAWVDKNGLDSGYVARNEVNARWSTLVNLAVRQELPTFFDGTSGEVYFLLYNLGNFLNDRWGHQSDAEFFSQEVVDAEVNDQGQYVYTNFKGGSVTDKLEDPESLWEAKVGVNFRF
ncbi:carboxypeptidase regulatory-like domain-containing protein [Halioxenophilus sp. WMMB6]|uniref:TonB-dependent receptor n=1 Tax=Halioxenophilus sp. WMMB6 TaxID=3073815 RepID=UPI00295F4F3F|nr:carboxypeptidase regulatory-like domain-containing protein [Halioxenophilus sp. WMMB6]